MPGIINRIAPENKTSISVGLSLPPVFRRGELDEGQILC